METTLSEKEVALGEFFENLSKQGYSYDEIVSILEESTR